MEVRIEEGGRKGGKDRRIFIKTNGEEMSTYRDLFTLIKAHLELEEELYPRPLKAGWEYLLAAIRNLTHMTVEEVLAKYKVSTTNPKKYFKM